MSSLEERYSTSALSGMNAAAIEALYEEFIADPDSVPESWRSTGQLRNVLRATCASPQVPTELGPTVPMSVTQRTLTHHPR